MRRMTWFDVLWIVALLGVLQAVGCGGAGVPWYGYLAASLCATGFICAIAIMAVQWIHGQPTMKIGRFGLRWRPTAQPQWPGLATALNAIELAVIEMYGAAAADEKGLLDFWVTIYAPNELLVTERISKGVIERDGARHTVWGTLEKLAFFLGLKQIMNILVMQILSSRTVMPDGQTMLSGALADAGQSALFHEVAQHHIPWCLTRDFNANHDPKWAPLEQEMKKTYAKLRAAGGG